MGSSERTLSLKADDCHYTRLHLRRTYPDTLYNPTKAMTRTSDQTLPRIEPEKFKNRRRDMGKRAKYKTVIRDVFPEDKKR